MLDPVSSTATSTIEQVFEYKFPSGLDWTIVVSVSLDDIAARFGMEPGSWVEDGLVPHEA